MGPDNLIDFDAVWASVLSVFPGDRSSIHGPKHWHRVEANGIRIATVNHASIAVVRLFAILHDSRRVDDSSELVHGELAAAYAETLRRRVFDMDDDQFELLQYSCRWHTHGKTSSDPTIGACWDADRLDLTRVGIIPDPDLMSTEPGKKIAARMNKSKRARLLQSRAILKDARKQILLNSNSFNRMDKLLDVCPLLEPYGLGKRILSYQQWLHLIGENWTGCDVITLYRKTLKSVLGVTGPIREMMNVQENAIYDRLPDTVTVYRGCSADHRDGLCWSLDEQIANAFPFQRRFRAKDPILIRARAKKSRILAVKMGRNETEVITFSPRVAKIRAADRVAALALLEARRIAQNARIASFLKKSESQETTGQEHG